MSLGCPDTVTVPAAIERLYSARKIHTTDIIRRLAMNSHLQGTAADLLKLAMIKVHHALKSGDFKTKTLLAVHDEIVFDLHRSEQSTAVPLIVECMRTALEMKVPILVETGIGPNWFAAH